VELGQIAALMYRIFVYQAIVGVLLCPYTCAVRASVARAPAESSASVACCEDCQIRRLAQDGCPSQDHGPADPQDPSEDGRSCLCEGAVFDASAGGPADSLLEASLWAVAVTPAGLPESTMPDWNTWRTTDQPPPPWGGRQARIAFQSFLL
jgi:hypothetical protein